jgi:hypothetical protein
MVEIKSMQEEMKNSVRLGDLGVDYKIILRGFDGTRRCGYGFCLCG